MGPAISAFSLRNQVLDLLESFDFELDWPPFKELSSAELLVEQSAFSLRFALGATLWAVSNHRMLRFEETGASWMA
jgi:hypothetical protein